MPCTATLDLSDPLLLMSHNTSILEYNYTIEFTYYAVNGAGHGIFSLQATRPLSGKCMTYSVCVECAEHVIFTQRYIYMYM